MGEIVEVGLGVSVSVFVGVIVLVGVSIAVGDKGVKVCVGVRDSIIRGVVVAVGVTCTGESHSLIKGELIRAARIVAIAPIIATSTGDVLGLRYAFLEPGSDMAAGRGCNSPSSSFIFSSIRGNRGSFFLI